MLFQGLDCDASVSIGCRILGISADARYEWWEVAVILFVGLDGSTSGSIGCLVFGINVDGRY